MMESPRSAEEQRPVALERDGTSVEEISVVPLLKRHQVQVLLEAGHSQAEVSEFSALSLRSVRCRGAIARAVVQQLKASVRQVRLQLSNLLVHPIPTLNMPGDYGAGVPPVPIPNTEVKPCRADGTAA